MICSEASALIKSESVTLVNETCIQNITQEQCIASVTISVTLQTSLFTAER